ncbi:hypothetical protein AC629_23875 [Bradyrhizobium sp. NAS80.1]|uniref:tetratricopeptide repeat protein n=1 Tax=Bradyrhizobium sp. NAS80.1 TaxID=1680159 RepID=UPI000967FFED|nr:tetratricopeptide repeat protein [Bradyrhizobium sp. NAS80.1]OKO82362.1 hypothetical protein AC629_23875 [Bradyrhizobium sp. NAS80.1]
MFGMTGRALVGAVAGVSALALTTLIDISAARAELPLATKCNTVGNFNLDDRIAGCTAIIQAATAMQQSVIMAHFRRAMFYRQKGEIGLAIADYDQIIEHDPGNLNVRLQRAFAHVARRDTDAALADYDKVVELDPTAVYAHLGRARIYQTKGDIDRAIADYDQGLRIHPDNVIAHVDRGLAYNVKGEPDRGIADCNRAIEISPQDGAGQFCRGQIYLAKGDNKLALAEFDRAIGLNPKYINALFQRAITYVIEGNFDRAVEDYDRILQINPRDARAYFHPARVHWQSASFAKSLTDLDQAIQLSPKSAYPVLWREIVAKRSDQPSQLSEAARQLDATKWPAPIVNLFLGTMTLEQVLDAADDRDPRKKNERVCEANFYIAERALQRGSKEEALKPFGQAAADCPKTFIEKQAADFELSSLRASR